MGRCVDAFPTPLPTFSFLLLPFSFRFRSPVSSPCLSPTVGPAAKPTCRSRAFFVLLTGQKDQKPPARSSFCVLLHLAPRNFQNSPGGRRAQTLEISLLRSAAGLSKRTSRPFENTPSGAESELRAPVFMLHRRSSPPPSFRTLPRYPVHSSRSEHLRLPSHVCRLPWGWRDEGVSASSACNHQSVSIPR